MSQQVGVGTRLVVTLDLGSTLRSFQVKRRCRDIGSTGSPRHSRLIQYKPHNFEPRAVLIFTVGNGHGVIVECYYVNCPTVVRSLDV